MRRLIVWGLVVLGLVAALALAPSVLTRSVAGWLTARTGVPTTIAWMSWNPLLGRVSMHGIRLGSPSDETPMVTVGDVRITIALRALLAGRLSADEIVFVDPWVGLRRTANGDFNLSALFPAVQPSPAPIATPASPAPADDRTLAVRRLRIEGGAVQFRDEATLPMLETSLYLEDIVADDLSIDLSGTTNVTVHLESRLEREPLTLDLTYRAQGGDSSLRARLATASASLARTLLYVPVGWQQVSGTLDVALDYVHDVSDGRLAKHSLAAEATMHQVALVEPWAQAPALRAARIRMPALVVDFVRQRTDLGVIKIDEFQAAIVRDEDGLHIPLMHGDAAPDTKWQTVLSAVELGTGELLLRHVIAGAEPETTARVRKGAIQQTADELSFTLETEIAGGRIVAGGRSGGDALSMRFDLDGVALPELADHLQLPVRFATGSVDGHLLARFDDGPARLSGTLSLPGAKSLPPAGGDDGEVFAWHDLTLELGESTLQPLAIHVRRATAGWPYLMMQRSGRGIFPFARAGTTGDAQAPPAEPTPAPGPIVQGAILRVDEGRAHGGRIEFYDTTLDPPYWTELAELDFSFRDLVMRPFVAGHLELTGALDWISPLAVRGTIGSEKSDLRIQVSQLRLAPLNPYLEPALGYRVTSGLARSDSTIALAGTNVETENDLVLSRFALKRTGDEPFEIGMPLPVALALMKDTRGEIRLPLTVRGDLSAQRYQFTNLFLTGLREALVGTLRTPLRLLGSAFRRDQPEQFDLQPVPFALGSSVLGPEGEARIATLARLLAQHTALRAVLAPDPSPADAMYLRDEQLIARLTEKPATERRPVEDVILTFLRARHAGASPAPLPQDAMQELAPLEASIPLPLDRLKELADARGTAVVRHLTETHETAASRVGLTRWKPAEPQAETVPGVDVQLRGD